MKKIYFILCLLSSSISFSQALSIEWQKCLGGTGTESAMNVKQTADGGYISVGFTTSIDGDINLNHGGQDLWVQKVNSSGILEWQKSYGGSLDDYGYCIIGTADGGYLISGMTCSNDGDVSGNHTSTSGYWDAWLLKISNTGIIQWQKCYGSTGTETAKSVIQTTDGGYIFTGNCQVNDGDVTGNHGNLDVWCVKVNSSGVLQWQKSFGGTGEDRGYKIKATSGGGYIVCGYTVSFNGDVTGNHGNNDAWVLKLSSTGILQWQKCYGGLNIEQAESISMTSDGGYIFAGKSNSTDGDVTLNNGNQDVWVVKINNTGVIQWQKSFGGSNSDYAHEIVQTADGGYVISANTTSNDINVSGNHGSNDAWVVKIDSYGTMLWQQCFGSSSYDDGYDIITTIYDGLLFAGHGAMNNGDVTGSHGGLYDTWLVKLFDNSNCNNFYITSNGNYSTTVNSGANVSCMPITVNSTLPLAYNWYLNTTLLSNGINYSGTATNQLTVLGANYTQDDNTNYFKCFITNNYGCTDTAYFQIDVCDDITQQPTDITANVNSTATFSVAHTDPSATYQWKTDIGNGFQNVTNAGQYSGANTNTLTVSNLSTLNNNQYFYCRISSHCNTAQYSDTVVLMINSTNSIEESDLNLFTVSPNPVQDELHISSQKMNKDLSYLIYNPLGDVVMTGKLVVNEEFIDCQELKTGMYFLQIGETNSRIKFIKN